MDLLWTEEPLPQVLERFIRSYSLHEEFVKEKGMYRHTAYIAAMRSVPVDRAQVPSTVKRAVIANIQQPKNVDPAIIVHGAGNLFNVGTFSTKTEKVLIKTAVVPNPELILFNKYTAPITKILSSTVNPKPSSLSSTQKTYWFKWS